VVHQTADPEVIIVEQEAAGTVTTTGRPFTLPNIIVLKVRDGQIVHLRDYVNILAVAEATDRLPALLASISSQKPAPVPPDACS
jgi:ketosteroid isomerase-like protein